MIRKIIFNTLLGLVATVIFLLGLVFIVIEGRLLFSGDWLIYDNVIGGFLKYFFRLMIAIFACTHSVFTFINFKKNSSVISFYLLTGNVVLFIFGIFAGLYAANYVDIAVPIITTTGLLIKTTEVTLKHIFKK